MKLCLMTVLLVSAFSVAQAQEPPKERSVRWVDPIGSPDEQIRKIYKALALRSTNDMSDVRAQIRMGKSKKEIEKIIDQETAVKTSYLFEMFLITKKHELEEAEMFPDFLVQRLIAGKSDKWVFDAIIEHLTRFNKPEDRDIDGDFHLGFSKDLKKNEMFDLIKEFIDKYSS